MKKSLSLLLVFMMTLSGCSANLIDLKSNLTEAQVQSSDDEPSAKFAKLIKPFGLSDVDLRVDGKDNEILGAMIDENTLEVLAFAGEVDIVEDYADYIFVDVSGMSKTEEQEVIDGFEEVCDRFKDLSYCSINLGYFDDTIILLSLEFIDLDNVDNLNDVIKRGGVQATSSSDKLPTYLRLSGSAENLVNNGYIKR